MSTPDDGEKLLLASYSSLMKDALKYALRVPMAGVEAGVDSPAAVADDAADAVPVPGFLTFFFLTCLNSLFLLLFDAEPAAASPTSPLIRDVVTTTGSGT